MASDKTISIGFKVEDGADGLKQLIFDAESLRKVLSSSVVESEKLKGHFINFSSISAGIDSISSTIDSALSVVNDWSAAYDVQAMAETRLEQVMRNTMNATEEEIQSIKDFCSAQQEIGVVGDEVQLAGAQELATYLELKSSLQTLIPVMNDMLVQQNGLSSTGENAAQIASMLGKVMEGQVGALSRYGYKFDEAQEKVLKYGTEAQKVAVICDVVGQSVGGMNEAAAKTPAGKMQQIANTLGDWKEQLGSVAKNVQPILTIGANATIALGGVMKLVQGLKALNVTLGLTKAASGWIGLAIAAAATAIGWFMTSTNDATDSLNRFKTAEERAAEAAQGLQDAEQAGDDARKAAASSLELNIAKLKDFNGTKADEKKLVKEMNATYGETMGYFKKVSQWYNALIKNSKAYCDQMVAEAKARKYADQIAEIEIERDSITTDEEGNRKKYSKQRDRVKRYMSAEEAEEERKKGTKVTTNVTREGQVLYWGEADVVGSSDYEKAQTNYDALTQRRAVLKEKLAGEQKKVEMPVMGEAKEPELTDKQQKTRLQEINALLAKYQERFVTASETEKEQIRIKVAELNKEKEAIELAKAELERPLKLDSLDAYDKEIAYQTRLKQTASAEQVVEIEKTITRLMQERTEYELTGRTSLSTIEDYEKEQSRLQAMMKTADAESLTRIQERFDKVTEERELFERSAKARVSAEKITSYKELEEQISLCNEMLRAGTEEERRYAEENLPALRKKEKVMSMQIAEVGVATRTEDATNIEEITASISLLDQKIQTASIDEVEALTRSRMAFEEKKKAFERGIEIPAMQKEVADLQKLPDQVLKVKIEAMGFDGLSDKIREIQEQLDDIDNPPTEGQRKSLEELRSVYESWRKQCVMSFDTVQDGWSNVKGIGNGFESLSTTIQESTNAWQMITGVVDSFIQITAGIQGVLAIMEMVGIISKGNAAAKTAEATATVVAATATGVDAAAKDAASVAELPAVAANKALTASNLEVAASAYMAAHAYIPFAGFGIGSGFATAATTLVKSIGAMPFADGGVVYGPTLGLVGEYAGASSNPEVIAPLDRLRDIIGDTGHSAPVIVGGRLEISGRDLAVVLENQSRIAGLSGRKYKH